MNTVHSVTFSPDGARLLTSSADRTVRQWDTRTGQEVEPPYDRHSDTAHLHSAVYSPDGQWVASTGDDRTIRVWRAKGRKDAAVLHGHTGPVAEVAFTPDGRRLASLSPYAAHTVSLGDQTVRIWDVDPQATLPVLRGHWGTIYPLAYSPNGHWIASGSRDNTARLWDATTSELCLTLPHASTVWGLAFGSDGTWLVTGCQDDDRLRIWDVATARVCKEIVYSPRHIQSLTVSPDGTRVAMMEFASKSKDLLTVFDIASGKSLFSTEGACLAYSPDGRWIAIRAEDEKTVHLLDAWTHETVARFGGHENTVFKAAFSSDSRLLATCSKDYTVRLWQIDSVTRISPPGEGAEARPSRCLVLRGRTGEVYAVAFHPDDTRLATAGRDGVVWLWDLARGEEVVRLRRHKGLVWALAFSPDGATLASGSGDGTVRLWDTAPLKKRYQARREASALQPEAERLVEQFWRELKDPTAVVAAIRSGRVPDDALRHAALRSVMRRVQPPYVLQGNPLDLP